MKILFVGGSNTLMLKGYVHHFRYLYQKFIGEELIIKNIAIGANSCVHGLELIKNETDLSAYDCVVVEYIVNDYKLASGESFDTWQRAYEGLLRTLIVNCASDVRIINLVLGRRDSKTFSRQKKLTNEIERYVADYMRYADIDVLDVTGMLMKISDDKPDIYSSFFQDDAHYSVPLGSSMVASLLLTHLMVRSAREERSPFLPWTKAESRGFEDSVVIRAADFGSAPRQFKNSRIELNALAITPGESIEIDLPGNLVAFSYVSTFDCLSVAIEEDGQLPFLIDGRHQWTKTDPSRFMLKNLPLTWKNWDEPSERRRVRFTAVSESNRHDLSIKYVKQHNVKEPDPEPIENACFYLVSLLALDNHLGTDL